MAKGPALEIVRLDGTHKIDKFGCGESKLNHFLKNYALQHQQMGFSVTFVALRRNEPDIAGYVSVSASSVPAEDFGQDIMDQLEIPAKFAIPTLHVGRVAVRSNHHRGGIGRALMWHAFDLAIEAHDQLGMGVFAVDLFIENPELLPNFYSKFDFYAVDKEGKHLCLPLSTIRQVKAQRDAAHN